MNYVYLLSLNDEFFIARTNASYEEWEKIMELADLIDRDDLSPITINELVKKEGFETTINEGDGYFALEGSYRNKRVIESYEKLIKQNGPALERLAKD